MVSNIDNILPNNDLGKKRRVLVVDDERDLVELVAYNLKQNGYDVAVAFDGRSALAAVAKERPDLVLLDVMLPGLSGTEVASRLRADAATATLPIVMLTAKADEVDQVVGLTVGADDYITKPFSTKVLLARIEALLRRAAARPEPADALKLGPIEIDPDTHEARADGRTLKLTLTEFRLLAALIGAGGRVLSRHRLMSLAMGPGITVTERTIDVHITAIRRKLGEHGAIIRTVRGVGYRAALEPEQGDA